VVRTENGGYAIRPKLTLFALPRLVKMQWRLSAVLAGLDDPVAEKERLFQSLKLGVALQVLQMRLPTHTSGELARWLSDPPQAPQNARTTLNLLHQIQLKRTKLSHAWTENFSPADAPIPEEFPDHFWDEFRFAPVVTSEKRTYPNRFQGTPIYGGTGAGTLGQDLLVFAQATPHAVEQYSLAKAVFFARGGVLSHACVVAREQKLPCITGLGPTFFERVQEASAPLRARFNAQEGWIEVLPPPREYTVKGYVHKKSHRTLGAALGAKGEFKLIYGVYDVISGFFAYYEHEQQAALDMPPRGAARVVSSSKCL
jgi:hypothetical protein